MITTALTAAAYLIFPAWDDGAIWMMSVNGAKGLITASHDDRPVLGAIWEFFSDRGLLVQAGLVLHWLTWFSTGWITMRLWKLLLPQLDRFALPVACLALAPVLCRTQYVLINPILGGQVGSVLVYLAVLLLLDRGRATAQQLIVSIAAAAMVLLGSLLSEYSVPAVIVGSAVLVGTDLAQERRVTCRQAVSAVILLAAGAVGYLVYHHLGDPNARPDVRPELSLVSEIGWRGKWVPLRVVTMFWQASLGGFFNRLGALLRRFAPCGR